MLKKFGDVVWHVSWSVTRNILVVSVGDNKVGMYIFSRALARAKRAWDRAPYSWNMVNLFSFGCHVIDRAYVRTYVRTYVHTYVRIYRLYGWGRGDYQKEGRGVSGVSWQVHIFNIGF